MSIRRLLLLLNECLSGGANSGDLDNDLPVLCPAEVRRFRGLRIEGTGRISLKLAFVPLLASTEVERTGEDNDCSRLIRMPMRRVLRAGWELDARDKQTWLFRITIEHHGLRRSSERPLKLDVLR